jgi:hypothetical protein
MFFFEFMHVRELVGEHDTGSGRVSFVEDVVDVCL